MQQKRGRGEAKHYGEFINTLIFEAERCVFYEQFTTGTKLA